MNKETLTSVGIWAQDRVASGEEPPFTFHKLKQLVDITNFLVEGMDATAVFQPQPAQAAALTPLPENVVQFESFRSEKPESEFALPS